MATTAPTIALGASIMAAAVYYLMFVVNPDGNTRGAGQPIQLRKGTLSRWVLLGATGNMALVIACLMAVAYAPVGVLVAQIVLFGLIGAAGGLGIGMLQYGILRKSVRATNKRNWLWGSMLGHAACLAALAAYIDMKGQIGDGMEGFSGLLLQMIAPFFLGGIIAAGQWRELKNHANGRHAGLWWLLGQGASWFMGAIAGVIPVVVWIVAAPQHPMPLPFSLAILAVVAVVQAMVSGWLLTGIPFVEVEVPIRITTDQNT